ncbi:MAG: phosphoadenylyl-sulfate reductase [Balneolaceae bacterium]|nr:MAG: phosphoadenylyl-sulfate reductase [Balneolaceae bacterium]
MIKVIEEKTLFTGKNFYINGSINRNLTPEFLQELNAHFKNSEPDEILDWGFHNFGKTMVVGTGFGPSGILLIHRLATLKIPATIFYLDTNLLFEETYKLKDEIEELFGIEILPVSTFLSLEQQAQNFGDELWKTNPDKCCEIRKVLPLKQYLSDKKAWVTGIRRNQATTRQETDIVEWDPLNLVVKINPLALWSNDRVWDYIETHNLPYNPLHDFGYPTIGCVPCTQPVAAGEDERSGRWKNLKKIECGIHMPAQNFKNRTDN